MARLNRLLAQALVILGLAPVAYALALLGWQVFTWLHGGGWVPLPARLLVDARALQAPGLAGVAPFIPGVSDWPWLAHPKILIMPSRVLGVILERAHVGALAALAGWALIAFGRGMAARQAEILEWQERERADRLRRAAQYRI
jgi:hypothetical protein